MDDVQQSGSQSAAEGAVVNGQTEATGTTATVTTSGRVSQLAGTQFIPGASLSCLTFRLRRKALWQETSSKRSRHAWEPSGKGLYALVERNCSELLAASR
jgi:hypothetical protein